MGAGSKAGTASLLLYQRSKKSGHHVQGSTHRQDMEIGETNQSPSVRM